MTETTKTTNNVESLSSADKTEACSDGQDIAEAGGTIADTNAEPGKIPPTSAISEAKQAELEANTKDKK